MPVDASIISGLRQPEQANPLQTIGSLMAIREGQARQALQAQQIRASQAQVADVEQQTAQRDRQNQSLATVTDILKDPTHAAAVGRGDVSELHRRGVSPDVVQQVQKGVLENQKSQAALDADTLKLNGEKHAAIGKALDGILSTYGDRPDLLPGAYQGTLNSLIAEGHLKKGTFPESIKDAAELKNLAAVNGYQANINDAALSRRGAEQKIDTEASTAEMNRAHGRNFDADATKTAAMLPLEVTGKTTANAQAAKVLAGTSATGVTAVQEQEHQDRAKAERDLSGYRGAELEIKKREVDPFGVLGLNPHPVAAGGDIHGEEFLKGIPAALASEVKAVAEGRQTNIPRKNTEQFMGLVNQYDPTYSAQRAQVRSKFLADPNTGALNTAVVHLDRLSDAAEGLNNGSFRPGNALFNAISSEFGGSKVTTFEGLKTAVAGEMATALKGTATDQEIAHIDAVIKSKNSPKQLADYAQEMTKVLGDKLNTKDEQYHATTGPDDKWTPILPTARAVFDKRGIKPLTRDGGGKQAPAVGAIEDGHRFKGGSPADPKNWEAVR